MLFPAEVHIGLYRLPAFHVRTVLHRVSSWFSHLLFLLFLFVEGSRMALRLPKYVNHTAAMGESPKPKIEAASIL